MRRRAMSPSNSRRSAAIPAPWDIGAMFDGASWFNQDLGWCVPDDVRLEDDDEVSLEDAFHGTKCEATSCGVDTSSGCAGIRL